MTRLDKSLAMLDCWSIHGCEQTMDLRICNVVRQMHSKTYGQKDRCTVRHMDRKTYGQKDIWTERHMDRKTYGQKDIWTERHMDRKAYGQKYI